MTRVLPPTLSGLLIAVLTITASACNKSSEAEGRTPDVPPVVLGAADVATARLENVGEAVMLSGALEPSEVVIVKAQVAGTVTGVRVDRGTAVRRGERMALIEATGITSQAAGARAGVAAAEANLALARQRLEAARTLRQAGAMSEIDFRAAVAAEEAAVAQVAAARAQAATAGEAAARTIIDAPIDGIVSDRQVENGEAVNPGAELFTVVNSRTLELTGRVGVAEASRVRVGQPVVFALDAFPGEPLRGQVARKDPTADPGTRQVGVYVQLPNPGGRLVGGQFARGRVLTGSSVRQVVVPESAVQRTGDSTHVLVIVDGRIVRRPVVAGPRDEAQGVIAITSGLQDGEQVVVAPSGGIAEGTSVTIMTDSSRSFPTTPSAAKPGGR